MKMPMMKMPQSGHCRTPKTMPAVWMSFETKYDAAKESPIVITPKKNTFTQKYTKTVSYVSQKSKS